MDQDKARPGSGPVVENDVSRRIIHIDMDAFFASVEQRDNPELRGRPIAVGHADRRGVVAAASYEARRFGVRSAMPSARARQLCPQLVFVEGRMKRYREVSLDIREIFARYTDLIEPISIDEAFLDVTRNYLGITLGVEIAKRIKSDIRRELGLVASAGVSYNKFLAKVASDWRKPDGLCTIHPDHAQRFIDQLPIEAFWGVGPVTARRFRSMGVDTGAKLRAMSYAELVQSFGQQGAVCWRFARGIDDRPVVPHRERKSVGCEETFSEDVCVRGELLRLLKDIVEELVRRRERTGFLGRTLTLKIRFHDFSTKTRSVTALEPFVRFDDILGAASALLNAVEIPAGGVRLLGASISGTAGSDDAEEASLPVQTTLF